MARSHPVGKVDIASDNKVWLADRKGVRHTTAVISTPIGLLEIAYSGKNVERVDLCPKASETKIKKDGGVLTPEEVNRESAVGQLLDYFNGKRKDFDLSPNLTSGTEFQRKVWEEMSKIPPGSTLTYGDLAEKAGNRKAARAVGMAAHRNPIAIVVPCHRVVGSKKSLGGYGMGTWRKKWLLSHERTGPFA